jgi:hypothetical protein
MSTATARGRQQAAENCKPPQAGHVESEVVYVTPEQAQHWLENHLFEGQRTVVQWRVDRYAAEMRAGRFEPTEINFYHLARGGGSFLLNGQHRLWAVIESGCTVPFAVTRKWVATYEEVRDAYRRLDAGKARTAADGLRATGLHQRLGLTERQVNAAGTAIRILAAQFNRTSVPGGKLGITLDEVAVGIERWQDEIRAYFGCITPAKGAVLKGLHEGTVVAVALITLRYQREMARDFWASVAANDQLKRNSGPWWTVELITQPSRKRDLREYARRLASAWRAYWNDRRGLKGGEIGHTLVRDVARPLDLDGCAPYNGEQHVRLEL